MAQERTLLNARDVISGEQGDAYAIFNGKKMNLMHLKNIEATIEFEKEDVAILGKRGKGHKKVGENYTGSMTVYMVTTYFRQLARDYKGSGVDFYFNIQIINHDNTSRTGTQIITLKDCNLDSVALAKLDADSAILDEDMDFTFEDYTIDRAFNDLAGLWA